MKKNSNDQIQPFPPRLGGEYDILLHILTNTGNKEEISNLVSIIG